MCASQYGHIESFDREGLAGRDFVWPVDCFAPPTLANETVEMQNPESLISYLKRHADVS